MGMVLSCRMICLRENENLCHPPAHGQSGLVSWWSIRTEEIMKVFFAVLILTVTPACNAAACKGRVVVEWANQRRDDPLVSELLARVERKARVDGYCVDHLDLYDSLGGINSKGTYVLAQEIKDSPIAVVEVRSVLIAKNRSIIVSQ